MYNTNRIAMWFWVCRCKACRHLSQDRNWKRNKHRKNPYREQVYRLIIKKLRQAKHLEDIPRWTFNTWSYTD